MENAPVIDDQSNILIFKTTSEGTNFKVHFTIRAQKVHSQMEFILVMQELPQQLRC